MNKQEEKIFADGIISEINWLRDNIERCPQCGHKRIFHNTHCCSFCLVCHDCEYDFGFDRNSTRPIKTPE